MRYLNILFFLAVAFSSVAPVSAATLTVSANGNGGFIVLGDGMSGVAGIDLAVGYDAARLSNPSVTWGPLVAGALSVANTNIPGSIKIAIIKAEPFAQGNGAIATISFAMQRDNCGISQVSAKLIDEKTTVVPVQINVASGVGCGSPADSTLTSTPGVPFSQSTTSASAATPAATSAAAGAPAPAGRETSPAKGAGGLGSVSMAGEPTAKEEKPLEKPAVQPQTAESAQEAIPQPPTTAVDRAAESAEAAPLSQTTYTSMQDRFRNYRGDRTPETMLALLEQPIAPDIQQEPLIVVSDGKSTARVSLDLAVSKGMAANIALIGGTAVNLKNGDEAGRLVIDIQPQAQATKTVVTIISGRAVLEYPLTVVTPTGAVSGQRAGFAAFLKDSGAKTPKFDLNGDGRHDYLDDFIYTAHYRLKMPVPAAKTAR